MTIVPLKDIARAFRVDSWTVREWLRLGKLKGEKVNSRWQVRLEDYNSFAAKYKVETWKLKLSKDELLELVEDRLYEDVARELGVKPQTISYHMRKYGIKRKTWRRKNDGR